MALAYSRIGAKLPLVLALGVSLSGALFAATSLAAIAGQSPWVSATNSKVRLVSGTVADGGKDAVLAGVQIRMDEGWKTYWRNPGDSGVPPSFDWSGSKNLKHAEVLYPAPHRFADANGTAIGYADEVVFPVRITPEREGEAVELKLAVDYGLCKSLCIPNEAELSLAIPADAAAVKGDSALIETFLARVPKPAEAGALPAVQDVENKLDGAKPELLIDALFLPDARGSDLFIEAPDMFVPVPKPLGPLADGRQRFTVSFTSPEEAASIKGKPLTLTLVSDAGSREMTWTAE